jgi:hypothetical protein
VTGGRLRPLADGGTARPFHRALAAEAGVGILVLLLAGVLTAISPGTAGAEPDLLRLDALGDEYSYSLEVSPAPSVGGTSMFHVTIRDAAGVPVTENSCGRPAESSCVRITLSVNGGDEHHDAFPDGAGRWMAHGILWTTSGPVNATIEVSTADVFLDTAHTTIVVP